MKEIRIFETRLLPLPLLPPREDEDEGGVKRMKSETTLFLRDVEEERKKLTIDIGGRI